MSAIYRETSALSLVILVPLAACLFRKGRPKLRLMMPANSQSQGSVSLSSEMTCSEALRRHPERNLQSTLRPVAGDPCAPRRVHFQKKPPEVPSKKNVLLQVLLSTVQYSIADPPILSSSPRNGSRTAGNGDMRLVDQWDSSAYRARSLQNVPVRPPIAHSNPSFFCTFLRISHKISISQRLRARSPSDTDWNGSKSQDKQES